MVILGEPHFKTYLTVLDYANKKIGVGSMFLTPEKIGGESSSLLSILIVVVCIVLLGKCVLK